LKTSMPYNSQKYYLFLDCHWCDSGPPLPVYEVGLSFPALALAKEMKVEP
jgi:hypothetical protein